MEARDVPGLRFNLSELAGAFGDFGIIIPLMFAVIAIFFAGPGFQQLISPGVYGALLLFVGIEMGKHGLKPITWRPPS